MKAGELIGGRYEVRGVLGRGGMAEVRDGWDMRLARPVAIKLLYPAFGVAPENRLRFEAEARAAATLTSAHIVVVHDSGEHDGIPYIVMERLPGASLAQEIAKGPLPQPLVRDVLDDVLAALAVAHDAGILHRDIKPGNILFTGSGEAKVTDFGIAKTAGAAYTMTGQIVGTMAYLSPERIAGKPATVSDDLYAVGVVGYEALAGRRPFMYEDVGALAHAILSERPPPLAALRPDVEPTLAAVIERAMAHDPRQRFHSAPEMRAALLGGEPLTAPLRPATRVLAAPLPPTFAPTPIAVPPAGHKRTILVGVAVFAALVLAIILLAIGQPSTSPPTPATSTTTPVTAPAPTFTTRSPTSPVPQPPPPRRPGKRGGDEGD